MSYFVVLSFCVLILLFAIGIAELLETRRIKEEAENNYIREQGYFILKDKDLSYAVMYVRWWIQDAYTIDHLNTCRDMIESLVRQRFKNHPDIDTQVEGLKEELNTRIDTLFKTPGFHKNELHLFI